MRYTEVRMSKIASELLADIEKETVDSSANYDESESEPGLPHACRICSSTALSGIAWALATNIPRTI